jgi:hypothetical protein
LLTSLLPASNVQEVVRATAVWNQHRAEDHPGLSFVAFFCQHFLSQNKDDVSSDHHTLPIHPQQDAPWAVMDLYTRVTLTGFVVMDDHLARLYHTVEVQPARQGVSAPLWRPPQV